MGKFREFWIDGSNSFELNESITWAHWKVWFEEQPTHVIEYRAYEELLKQNEELKQKLEVARNTLKAIASLKIEDFKSHYELSGKLDLIEILELDALDARQALKEIGE